MSSDVAFFLAINRKAGRIILFQNVKSELSVPQPAHLVRFFVLFIYKNKSVSERIRKEFNKFNKNSPASIGGGMNCFWSQSFCLLTTDGIPLGIIKKYIESQGERQ